MTLGLSVSGKLGKLETTSVDWRALVFDPDWMERLDRLAAKRFGDGGLAEEASAYVIEKLSEQEWSALQSFKGQSSPTTFLHTLAGNFIEEFSRKRFGRPRPPEWVKREGDLWIQIWKLLCLERRMPQTVLDLLCSGDRREPASIQRIIQTLKARLPWCGESAREIASAGLTGDDGEFSAEEMIPEYRTPDATIENEHFCHALQMLSTLLSDEITEASIENSAAKAQAIVNDGNSHGLKNLGAHLQLNDQEWVVLRLVYQDGLKLHAVAEMLGLKAYEPGRILKRSLDKIAENMATLGVDKENFLSML